MQNKLKHNSVMFWDVWKFFNISVLLFKKIFNKLFLYNLNLHKLKINGLLDNLKPFECNVDFEKVYFQFFLIFLNIFYLFQKMLSLFVFLFPLVLGEQFLFSNERDLEQELPQCIGNGVLSCQRVRSIWKNKTAWNLIFLNF